MSVAPAPSFKPLLPEPVLLVYNEAGKHATDANRLVVDPKAAEALRAAIGDRRVRVCSIVGPMRTGKSLVMNLVVGHSFRSGKKGFDLGHEVDSKTKGIWAWAGADSSSGEVLVALDTEGLGDPTNNSATEDDIKRFILVILLSSHVTLNIQAVVNADCLDKLSFVTNLTRSVTTKRGAGKEDCVNFNSFFPQLLFLIRDFSLGLKEYNGSAEVYLQRLLETSGGLDDASEARDKVRGVMLRCFPQPLQCHLLCTPTERPEKQNQYLDTDKAEEVMRPEFKKGLQDVVQLIRKAPLKRLNDAFLTGAGFPLLLDSYVKDMNDPKKVASIPNAFDSVARVQARKAVESAAACYTQAIKGIALPMEHQALLKLHMNAQDAAGSLLKETCTASSLQSAQHELSALIDTTDQGKTVGGFWHDLQEANRKQSMALCKSIFTKLIDEHRKQLDGGTFKTPAEFTEACKTLEAAYGRDAKGPLKAEVLAVGQQELAELGARLAMKLQLSAAERLALENEQKLHQEQQQGKAVQEALTQLKESSAKAAEAAEHRQRELVEKLESERKRSAADMKQLLADQEKAMEKVSEDMRRKMEAQGREMTAQAAEEAKKRDADWEKKLDEEKKRSSTEVQGKRFPVPVYNPQSGCQTTVYMTEAEINALKWGQGTR